MKTTRFFTWAICLFGLIGLSSCGESMDDNYKKYTNEDNYSGKITDLRCYIGFERIILAWDNPTDQKSKRILIEYADSLHKYHDTLVDSISIEGLVSGGGYEFTVYTLDADSNKSVPSSITALPISKEFVKNMTVPTCIPATKDGNVSLTWNGLSLPVSARFAGKIAYKIKDEAGNLVKEGVEVVDVYNYNLDGSIKSLKNIVSHTVQTPELRPATIYHAEYAVDVWPIQSKIITKDIVTVLGSARLNVK